MAFRLGLFVLVLFVITAVSLIVVLTSSREQEYRTGVSPELDEMVDQAKAVYFKKKEGGADLSEGPCLTNDLAEDWVADLVHSPRVEIDDLPDNQCMRLLEGKATHFVELDLNGNVVRVK